MKNYFANKMTAVRDGLKDNKGFSLVELIIVVAIMAVLMGVLAPQYLKFVESSRVQSDMSSANEVVKVMRTAIATQTSTPTGATVTWNTSATTAPYLTVAEATGVTGTPLKDEIDSVLGTDGSSVGAAASTQAKSASIVFTIAEDNGVPYVYCADIYTAYSLGIPNIAHPDSVPPDATTAGTAPGGSTTTP